MSKTGIFMAAAVAIALIGAGAGVYFTPNENDTVEIEIKDLFEVGDKHTMVVELGTTEYWISDVKTVGGDLRFDIVANGGPVISDVTYEELSDVLLGEIAFYETESDATAGDEERISTPFGERDCIVYTEDLGEGSEDVYYVGKNNDVVYRQEHLVNDVVTMAIILQKSSLMVESNTAIGLKNAEDIAEGDSVSFKIAYMSTLVIEGVNLPEGDGTVTYDVRISGSAYGEPLTRDEVIEEAGLVFSGDLENDLIDAGIEIIDTPLGKVKCDVYKNAVFPVLEMTYYVSKDVLVQNAGIILGITLKMYWEHTDLMIVK
ncbi:MAG: hypothetical protein AB7E75_02765 [Candidatus Methanomethylophilaceae archaeon]